jgi:replication fork protection complex subunit Csm3/Swi3
MATTAPNDEDLDDLFNYDVGIEDILNEAEKANDASSSNNQNKPTATKDSGDVLGLDEEVVVTKKRKPTVKFDETR